MSAAHETSTRCAIEMRGVSGGSMRDLNTIVVEDVNWSVAPGDFWVIGGLQGTGKSDFLMLTAGLMTPVAGTYCFLGEEMPIFEDHRLKDRLRLGFVFENGQLFNHLTVSENVSLPLRYHHNLSKAEAAPEVQKLLELTELAPWADSTPGAMTRNWQRRVGLARALMLRPDVLLLDNPLAGLDLRHRAWWLNLLKELSQGYEWTNGRPTTLVVTTNDLRQWRGDRRQFAVLKDKRFMVLGDWQKVEAAGDELVRELRASAAHND
ncbi:MAG TPA: ATP-binding cassette domain-containing protein [Verrucomicrobiae bacterium]|jgi:ABC-type transporter Mla maintaining outer membrane lipid asymmetry ATPase subunit MlaF|nr:ATP-binding cassette domain-containing protein [Verrucomicrobiae bacterium]